MARNTAGLGRSSASGSPRVGTAGRNWPHTSWDKGTPVQGLKGKKGRKHILDPRHVAAPPAVTSRPHKPKARSSVSPW